jgi:4-amino-4-deoxy-L-arabinose transferase-like glycosyltransferase
VTAKASNAPGSSVGSLPPQSSLRLFSGVGLALVAAAGIALRVWIYRGSLGIHDSDEAIVGLMVRHAAHGDLSTFYWGQGYGGSQEMILTTPLFWVFGQSWLALRIVPILISAAASIVLWRAGRRLFGETAGVVAGALLWIWPPFLLYKLTHQYGFYASDILYCGLLILLALRVVERPSRSRVALLGLTLGLAFWETEQIVPVAAVVIVWTIWRNPRCLRHVWAAAAAALAGALPWLIWNLRHGWGSFAPHVNNTDYFHRLRTFFSPILPMSLGLRVPFTQTPLASAKLVDVALLVLVALCGYRAYRARRSNAGLLYLIVFVFPFLYAISPFTVDSREPRYTVVLAPVFALLVAQFATRMRWAVATLAVGLLLTVVVIHRMQDAHINPVPGNPPIAPQNVKPVIAELNALGLDRVYANYWAAFILDFESREKIIATDSKLDAVTFRNGLAVVDRNRFVKYRPYEDKVRSASRTGFVLFRQTLSLVPFVGLLDQHGYTRHVVGPFVIFAPPSS